MPLRIVPLKQASFDGGDNVRDVWECDPSTGDGILNWRWNRICAGLSLRFDKGVLRYCKNSSSYFVVVNRPLEGMLSYTILFAALTNLNTNVLSFPLEMF